MSEGKNRTAGAGRFYCHVCRDEKPNQEIERLRTLLRDMLDADADCVFGEPAWGEREIALWQRVREALQ